MATEPFFIKVRLEAERLLQESDKYPALKKLVKSGQKGGNH
ncbi:hypothetical protein [Jeotgalibacillus terrae]|uniref:Uncharacterized protein n=1 Tax=Jeotgalibacillus terrae TaxID=587735 RepID=A0ABW5ZFS9_9BACL|nr:hypothetical protein [Jeotgalibacillus terrae]MBM7580058.1 hypothetical protein [Jeotgalibacillus terrae]